jgi:hypothetical protein
MYSPETLATLGTQDYTCGFSNVYLLPTICPVSCVPYDVSVSGRYILDCLIGFL